MSDTFLQILTEQLEVTKSEKFQNGKTREELHQDFKKVRYLLDSTTKNRYAKTSTNMNPLGGLWS